MRAPHLKSPIKVVRIIARLNTGGPALHCVTLSQELTQYGFDTTLITGNVEPTESSFPDLYQLKLNGFRFVKLNRLRRVPNLLGDLLTLFEIIKILKKEKPVIVHTHTAKAGVLGRMAAIVTGCPIIVHTFHGHVLSGYFKPWLEWLVRCVERALARWSSAIVTLSNGLRDELSSKFRVAPPSRFSVIPLGRDLDSFFQSAELRGNLRAELGIVSQSSKIIGTVGRLVPIKDHELLLKACSGLPYEIDWRLVLVGDGELRAQLEALALKLSISDRVVFLGWRSDLACIYADMDLFVISSKNEGTPLSLIEAFASGCASVSTAVGGIPDMYRKQPTGNPHSFDLRAEGALVPPGNECALRSAMEFLLRNDEIRKTCGDAARVTARGYTSQNLGRRVAELYWELLQSKPSLAALEGTS